MQIVLTTFNARYSHTALALRCLRANLGALREQSEIIEFDNGISPQAAAEKLLAFKPDILLFSVYIWNLTITSETVAILRALQPDLKILIGGPEVSYEYDQLALFQNADHLTRGEGEEIIEPVCRALLQDRQDAVNENKAGWKPAIRTAGTPSVPQASRLPAFNPLQSIDQSKRKNLPHWTQPGSTYFVTFRLADSIAQPHLNEYKKLREKWLTHNDPSEKTPPEKLFSEKVNEWLDQGAGSCILRNPEISKIVADTLLHFDGERYLLDEWVVMPNHVHALVTPFPGFELKSILHSWKSYSAHEINKQTDKPGTVWKQESYDHIVRNEEELNRIREYIRNNPAKAGITALQGKRDAHGTNEAGETPAIRAAGVTDRAPSVPHFAGVTARARLPWPLPKVIDGPTADLKTVALPYEEYTDADIAHRRVYVESTRGCPFSCDYCLSSLERGVRTVPTNRLFPHFEKLIERGARIFKFIDRSFNACPAHAEAVLTFFLEHRRDGMMLHLEWEPHLLPENLETILRNAPDGFFQLETGLQSFTPEVAERIHRKLEPETAEKNIRLLSSLPSIHLHADLIAGLPGETLGTLAAGFDRLHACDPHEIQLGILKKLRGAPIARHDTEFEMVYNSAPPYDVLQTSTMSFPELQAVRRFARFWDITVNNGRFPNSAPLIWENEPSVFYAFMEWTGWLYRQTHAVHGFTPGRLGRLLTQFLSRKRGIPTTDAERLIDQDLGTSGAVIKGMERQTRRPT